MRCTTWPLAALVDQSHRNARAERLIRVAKGADAHVVAYDDNLLAEARRYNDIALPGAMWSLRIAVDGWLTAVGEANRSRADMMRSERGAMVVSDVVASNAHDAYHHRWDLQRILQ